MVYGALGSTWPVNSGVLVRDGVAYLAAGIVDYDGTSVYALDAVTGKIKWRNHSCGHLNRQLRKGVSAQGTLTVLAGRLLLAGGNQVCPAEFDLQTGKCLSRAPAHGRPQANRGQEVSVFADRYVIFGGRLLYSAVEKVISPAMFHVRGPKRTARMASGRVPPAWDDGKFVYLHTLQGQLVCCDRDRMIEALARAAPPAPTDPRQRRRWRPWAVGQLKGGERRWTAANVTGHNALSVALAGNAVLAVCAVPQASGDKARWAVLALDSRTGKTMWRQPLADRPLPGGLLVDRAGRTVVACQNGQVVCFGRP